MQVVIKLPEEMYLKIKNGSNEFGNYVQLAIKYGTLLPDGHGRIADIDAAIRCIEKVTGEDTQSAIALIEWACGKRILVEADW